MMDTADMRNGHDLSLGWRLNWSQYRALFIERQVRSRLMIIPGVGLQYFSQMPFIENDDVIQTLSTDAANYSLDISSVPTFDPLSAITY